MTPATKRFSCEITSLKLRDNLIGNNRFEQKPWEYIIEKVSDI